MTVEQSFKLGAILKKLNINLEELKNFDVTSGDGAEKLGFYIISLVVDKYSELEEEIVKFISSYRAISPEEVRKADFTVLIETFKKIFHELAGGAFNHFLSSSSQTNGSSET
jgi:hypothetical protein